MQAKRREKKRCNSSLAPSSTATGEKNIRTQVNVRRLESQQREQRKEGKRDCQVPSRLVGRPRAGLPVDLQ